MIVKAGRKKGTVLGPEGQQINIPAGWELLPPGDAALTRKVKAMGEHYQIQEKKGRRTFSKGVWAPQDHICQVKIELQKLRSSDEYRKKRIKEQERKQKKQKEYQQDFYTEIIHYLNFAQCYEKMAMNIAEKVTAHATPVGSGTVARTKRIPIEKRVEAAVIAWMRHATTGYDTMSIARIKGERRKIRRDLAGGSVKILDAYRKGSVITDSCPLYKVLTEDDSNETVNQV